MKCICVDDYRQLAIKKLPKQIFAYIDSGADEQKTRHENQKAFEKIILMPRVLISYSKISTKTNILGHQLSLPFGFAPSAMHCIVHSDGQLIPAEVCQQKNICFTLSNLSTKKLSQIIDKNNNGLKFLQMYISKDWQRTVKNIQLAQKYGFQGIVITVDTQVIGKRVFSNKNPFDTSKYPLRIVEQITNGQISNRQKYHDQRDLKINWETIKRIKMLTNLKIILKGVNHYKDAKIATGVCDAIWISNHGGRQLDTMTPTIQLLQKIKKEVGNSIQVYIDGGVLTGHDIFKCLALGANYVFIGRPVMYSLVDGLEGVTNLVTILQDQFRRTMILTGTRKIEDINQGFIKHLPNL